jgi:ribonuclease D
MRPYQYVNTDKTLRAMVDRLFDAPRLALDTESNSLHAYRERVCLIQISTEAHDYLVDPLVLDTLAPLAPIMADNRIEKIVHAAENDVMALKRDFDFTFVNLFDTMTAARICGYKTVGLSALLEHHFNVRLDKRHQLDDWGVRPLAHESLVYAQMDSHYLGALRDRLAAELKKLGRCAEAWETFADLCLVAPTGTTFDPEGYWRIALPIQLSARQTAVLRELYHLREQIARARNLPLFRVLQDKTLAALARKAPQSVEEVMNVTDLPMFIVDEYCDALLDAIECGLRAKLPTPPPVQPPADPLIVDRYTALRDWRREKARERGVETDVIISKEALWEIATRNPTAIDGMHAIRHLGVWRLKTYGNDILMVLNKFRK